MLQDLNTAKVEIGVAVVEGEEVEVAVVLAVEEEGLILHRVHRSKMKVETTIQAQPSVPTWSLTNSSLRLIIRATVYIQSHLKLAFKFANIYSGRCIQVSQYVSTILIDRPVNSH